MKKAMIFPGQGSQSIGMGKELYDNFKSAKHIFDEVDDALDFNLSKIIFDGHIDELSMTENTQPALMTVSLAIINIITNDFGVSIKDHIDFVAGHSLGEYSAYTAAQSFSVRDAARILRIRGAAMQNSSKEHEGSMLAILGANIIEVEEIINKCANGSVLEIANDNCPGQIVISGSNDAIDRAIILASSLKLKAIKLKVSAAFHCSLVKKAGPIIKDALDNIDIKFPNIYLITNVRALPVEEGQIIKLLVEQVTDRVRWNQSINYMIDNNVTKFIEIGAGKVLTNLNKRINSNIESIAINNASDIELLVKELTL